MPKPTRGGRGAASASFNPTNKDDNVSKLHGKKLLLGTNSVTIKGENGKTAGVARGMSRVQTSNPQDQMMMHKFHATTGVDLRGFGVENVYKADGKIYVFNNTRGDDVAMKLKSVNKTEYGKLLEKNERLAAAEKAGVYIINHT